MLTSAGARHSGTRWLIAVAFAVAAAFVLGGWASSSQTTAGAAGDACVGASPPRVWRHVIWIWLENKAYGKVVGSDDAPFLTQLARDCGLATNYSAVSHPSLPNYLAATSGRTYGIIDDEPPAAHQIGQPSIFDRLAAAGRTWRAYNESMPSNCALTDSGRYAVKHNPAAYYLLSRRACTRWDVPLGTTSSGQLLSDLRERRLAAFSFVTPDLCNDVHDCPVSTGDAWLESWVPRIVASPQYQSGTTLLVVTFDESDSDPNRVPTIVVSRSTRPGTSSATPLNHYSLLKTTEQLLGLRQLLGHAADPATRSMRATFHLG
jgi:hypothetical protein